MKHAFKILKGVLFVPIFLLISNCAFGQYYISSVDVEPSTSKTPIVSENKATVTFNYSKPAGNVRIYIMPMTDGAFSPYYSVSGSPLYTANSGSGKNTFSLYNGGTVDQIRFRIVDANTNALLLEKFVPVNVEFVNYRITSFGFTPQAPEALFSGSYVTVTFNYQKKSGDIRVYTQPMYKGSFPSHLHINSGVLTENTGNARGKFTLPKGGKVDQIRIKAVDVTTGETLFTTYVDVDYTFYSYSISNVEVGGGSTATVNTNTWVYVTYDYKKISGEVRSWVNPHTHGSDNPNLRQSGSPILTANTGSLSRGFTLVEPGHIDHIYITILTEEDRKTVHEVYVPVDITFVNSLKAADAPAKGIAATNSVVNEDEIEIDYNGKPVSLTVGPVPADEELSLNVTGLENFEYRISDINGNIVQHGTSDSSSKTLNVRELTAGLYVVQIQQGEMILEKKIVIK